MKLLKVVFPLLFLVGLVVAVAPVSADAPGTNEDPFGGLPITGTIPGGEGIVAKFGLSPWLTALPGGIPSTKSGDGTTPRRAINISGLWGQLIPNNIGHYLTSESPDSFTFATIELPNCSTVNIPAGKARWFKLESYRDRRTQIWLDDELNGATKPGGSATFGAADQYMLGTAPNDAWSRNALRDSASQSDNYLEGFIMAVYDPNNLGPLWAFQPPNAAILSVDTDARGVLSDGPDNLSITDSTGAGIHGYGSHNNNIPNHLLWYEGRFSGWVFVMVYNQMIWDGTASVCSQRLY